MLPSFLCFSARPVCDLPRRAVICFFAHRPFCDMWLAEGELLIESAFFSDATSADCVPFSVATCPVERGPRKRVHVGTFNGGDPVASPGLEGC